MKNFMLNIAIELTVLICYGNANKIAFLCCQAVISVRFTYFPIKNMFTTNDQCNKYVTTQIFGNKKCYSEKTLEMCSLWSTWSVVEPTYFSSKDIWVWVLMG